MADREKVIKGLECCRRGFCFSCPYNDGIDENVECKQKWADDALSLLKAQEPVEPDVDVDTWICGKCGHKLEHQEMVGSNILFHEQYSYCPNCGRKVKWDD